MRPTLVPWILLSGILVDYLIGSNFRITFHLRGESAGDWWIPPRKDSNVERWCFVVAILTQLFTNYSMYRWFQTPSSYSTHFRMTSHGRWTPVWRHSKVCGIQWWLGDSRGEWSFRQLGTTGAQSTRMYGTGSQSYHPHHRCYHRCHHRRGPATTTPPLHHPQHGTPVHYPQHSAAWRACYWLEHHLGKVAHT